MGARPELSTRQVYRDRLINMVADLHFLFLAFGRRQDASTYPTGLPVAFLVDM